MLDGEQLKHQLSEQTLEHGNRDNNSSSAASLKSSEETNVSGILALPH